MCVERICRVTTLVIVIALMSVSGASVLAQGSSDAAQKVDDLKLQLIDVKAMEEESKIRVEQLDEALKPENIARSLAGVGSTRPEDLREQRRRQLTIEKTKITSQLDTLSAQRMRLESAIATAETQAYQQSARGSNPIGNGLLGLSPGMVRSLLIGSVVGVIAIVLFVGLLVRRVAIRNGNI